MVGRRLAAVLWRRRLRGQRWYVTHSLGFYAGDVDHVLVGPGGVYVVETKLRSTPSSLDAHAPHVDATVRQLRQAATRTAALIRQHARVEVEVQPLLLTHGRGWQWPSDEAVRHVRDVLVLRGGRSADWDDVLPSHGLSVAVAAAIVGSLGRYGRRQLRAAAR